MIKVGFKYKSVKTSRVLTIDGIDEGRNRLMTTSTGFGDEHPCIQIMDRFVAGIGTKFIPQLNKNLTGYSTLDDAAEHPLVLEIHKVDTDVLVKFTDGTEKTYDTAKIAAAEIKKL